MNFSNAMEETAIKRFFRARQKLIEPGFVSHITQRAAGKEVLFLEDEDYLSFLALLKKVVSMFSIECYAFCLMPNHVHLLFCPQKNNLDKAMRYLFSGYAIGFNKKYQRRGHLFGGPYRQAVCLDETYLLTASVYIHLNPVRAEISCQAKDYRWSSCKLYIQTDPPSSFVQTDFILKILSEDPQKAAEMYSRILSSGGEIDIENVLEQEHAVEKLAIGLDFMYPGFFRKLLQRFSPQNRQKSEQPNMLDIEKKINDLRCGNIQGGPQSRRARKYLIEQLSARGFKHNEIAKRLGICRKTVYNHLHHSDNFYPTQVKPKLSKNSNATVTPSEKY